MAGNARLDELRRKFDENPRRYFAPLANEYRKSGDVEQAIFICQEYLPQQPEHISGQIVYGQALFAADRVEESRTVFETALTLDPENLIALRYLGDIARGAGDVESARGWYRRVLEVDPRNEEIAGSIAALDASPTAAAEPPAAAPAAEAPTPQPAHWEWEEQDRLDAVASESESDSVARDAGPEVEPLETFESFESHGAGAEAAPAAAHDEVELDHPLEPFGQTGEPEVAGDERFTHSDAPEDHQLFELSEDVGAIDLPASGAPHAPVGSGAEPDPIEHIDDLEFTSFGFSQTPEVELERTGESTESPELTSLDGLEPFEPELGSLTARDQEPEEEVLPTPADSWEEAGEERWIDFGIEATEGRSTPEPQQADAAEHFEGIAEPPEAVEADGNTAEPEFTPESTPEPEPEEPAAPFDAAVAEADLETVSVAAEETIESEEPVEEDAPSMEAGAPVVDAEAPIEAEAPVEAEAPAVEAEAPVETEAPAMDAGSPVEAEAPAMEAEVPDESEAPAVEAEAPLEPSAPIDGGHDGTETPAEPAAAPVFATETMAQLYLEQGHRVEAIGIYRQLVRQRPDDEGLQARLAALEEQHQPEQPDRRAGPTIREYLQAIFTAGVGDIPAVAPDSAPRGTAPHADESNGAAPTDTESLDSFFGSAPAGAEDQAAAEVLAGAFRSDDATTPLRGVPAHRAPDELSLGRIFRSESDSSPSSGQVADRPGDFPLDQFFAADAAHEQPSGGADDGSDTPPSSDDVEQFNAWLDGLKKT